MKFIGYLRGLSLGYAISAENSIFEIDHVQDVAFYSEKLAFERGLDPNIALAIAYGHDLGRTKLGVVGKDHARVSARFMKALMVDSEFDDQTKSIIASAIKKHNIKSKCHGVYDELIKDADAFAHQDEGLLEDENPIEAYRILISNIDELSIIVSPLEAWREQYESHCKTFLKNMIHVDLFKDDSRHWIHEQRKDIRKLRSMIWYLKLGGSESKFETLDTLLKAFFSDLSEARMCQVQIEHLKKMSNPQSTLTHVANLQILEDRLSLALAMIENRLLSGYYDTLIGIFNEPFDVEARNFEDTLQNQNRWHLAFAAYLIKATETNPKKLKALHKMRISGKNFKYMSNLGLIKFSSESVLTVIEQLHDHIGVLNDLGDIKNMEQWQTYYDSSSVEAEIERIHKICKRTMFFFVKLNQMIKHEHLTFAQKNSRRKRDGNNGS